MLGRSRGASDTPARHLPARAPWLGLRFAERCFDFQESIRARANKLSRGLDGDVLTQRRSVVEQMLNKRDL